jgi:sulfatase modifying factor 1
MLHTIQWNSRMCCRILPSIFFLALYFVARAVGAITVATEPVGDVGNTVDQETGHGGVGYAYNIGAYEVTIGQYTAFLNAVAATDTYDLYNVAMATDLNVGGIARNGLSGSYTYSVTGSVNHPVTYVSWGDAARFANWLHNGQPTGAEGPGTTETGAYTLSGVTTGEALNAVARNTGSHWFIPTDDEWYKAAYYQPANQGGPANNYWTYPMRTNSIPYSDQPPGTTPDNTRVGNFYRDDGIANGYDDGLAVTGSTNYDANQNYLTDAGAYSSSPTYYGTFDQGGNVSEWTDTPQVFFEGRRLVRGGAMFNTYIALQKYTQSGVNSDDDTQLAIGFRVAGIPQLPGDFNGDLNVDVADYVIWRKSNGPLDDYNKWRANFGQSTAGGAAFGNSTSVPEPIASASIVMAGCASLAIRRRIRKS